MPVITPPPSDTAVGSSHWKAPHWKAFVVAPLAAAGVVGLAALWLSPPGIERAALVWLFAASAALAGSGLFALFAARREVRRLERELRRERAAAAWREDAVRAALLDDEADEEPDHADGEPVLAVADLRAAFDAAGEAMLILDRDQWVLGRNPAAAALLGAAAAPDTRWDDATVWPIPVVPLRVPLDNGGVLLVGRDSAQDRLRAAQLDRMDAAAELAGMIVHDVNNTLGAVAGYADFLVADLPGDSPQSGYAARILAATDRSKAGLRRLLSALRDLPMESRPMAATAVLAECDRLMRAAGRAAPALRNEAGTAEGLGDSGVLSRALVGFVLNCDHGNTDPGDTSTDEPGEARSAERAVAIRTARWAGTEDALRAPTGWACHSVLPPPPTPHLMIELRLSATMRAAPALTIPQIRALTDPLMVVRGHERAGLAGEAPPSALAVARAVDGGLVVWTHPTDGVVLRLFVPLAPSSLALAVPARRSTQHVLVVDESRDSGDRLSIGLERLGYEVAVCESAAEALEVLVDEPGFFDIAVVAGPMAGGMSALSLIDRFKALRPDLPCVLCAENWPATTDGADLVLDKPVAVDDLSHAIIRLIGHPRGDDEALE